MDEHDRVATLIQKVVRSMRQELGESQPELARLAFQDAYEELRKTCPSAPPLEALLAVAREGLAQAEVVRVNAQTGEPTYGPTYTFVVGGNILARGLTIDELLVTYYLREAKTPQMDTVWQHARMYGYRQQMMPYTRVYLPAHLGTLFRQIHESEEELRGLLKVTNGDIGDIPILKPDRARPTRPNAIETALRVYGADVKQILPAYVVATPPPGSAARILEILQQNNILVEGPRRKERFQEVPLQVLKEVVQLLPIREDDDGRWDTTALLALLTATAERYNDKGTIYARPFDKNQLGDPKRRRVRGALSGDEVGWAQETKRFTLVLIYWGDAAAPAGWYPHLVVPPDLPPHVFNPL